MSARATGAPRELGPRLERDLFGEGHALGATVRVGKARHEGIGIMAPKGRPLGIDVDDSVCIPVGSAMRLPNRGEPGEVDLIAASPEAIDPVAGRVRAPMIDRHDGHEDIARRPRRARRRYLRSTTRRMPRSAPARTSAK